MKSLFVIFIFFLLLFCACTTTFKVDGISYMLTSQKTVEVIKDIDGEKYTGTIIIPDTVRYGKRIFTVTGIGKQSFAFSNGLHEIKLPKSLKFIHNSAFQQCRNMRLHEIPNQVIHIGDYAFKECNALKCNLPDSLEYIGEEAFEMCENLQFSEIPVTVKTVGRGAFRKCEKLKRIHIPASVENLNVAAFLYCDSLKAIHVAGENLNYSSSEGVLFDKKKSELLQYPPAKQDSVYIVPYGVDSIGSYAFMNCKTLVSIELPVTLKVIKGRAFSCCERLASIEIPDSVVRMGWGAFGSCNGLTTFKFPDQLIKIEYQLLDHCNSLDTVILSRSVSEFDEPDFLRLTGVKFIDVSSDNSCFISMDGVLFTKDTMELIIFPPGRVCEYIIPQQVKKIGKRAFFGTKITGVVLPDSLKIIKYGAFDLCTGLTSIDIPGTVEEIDENAFSDCYNLSSITVHWKKPIKPHYRAFHFVDEYSPCILYIPQPEILLYREAEVWKHFSMKYSDEFEQL